MRSSCVLILPGQPSPVFPPSLAVTYPRVWLFRTKSDSVLLIHSFVLFRGYEQGAGMAEGKLRVRE